MCCVWIVSLFTIYVLIICVLCFVFLVGLAEKRGLFYWYVLEYNFNLGYADSKVLQIKFRMMK